MKDTLAPTTIRRTTRSSQAGHRTFPLSQTRLDVLGLAADYFCLRVSDFALLLRNREPNESDLCSVRHSLQRIIAAGYLHREPYFDLKTQGRSYVYGLSQKAIREFHLGTSAKVFDGHSARTLDHELEITSFHIALVRFCHENNFALYWQQKDLKRGIHPDAFFALTDPSKPEGRNTHYFFLEVERSKLGQYRGGEPSIMRKLERYARYFGSDQCVRDWNFRTFRVVVVQQTDERAANLLRALSAKLPYRTFWLTSEARYRRDLGAPIFLTPKDHAQQSYSLLSL